MVKYWKTADAQKAKVTVAPEGHYIMYIKGEKYPFPGFPRGPILFNSLSKLKHEIKNQIFNDTWKALDDGTTDIAHLKGDVLDNICELVDKFKINMLPFEKMAPPVKEIWRAWTEVEKKYPGVKITKIKEAMCFILQEDDGYRFRVQWIAKFLTWFPVTKFEYALTMLEHAEIVGDMKERIRLLRRVLLYLIGDPEIKERFEMFMREINWRKVKLNKADKYYFRAKYFKCDYPFYEY